MVQRTIIFVAINYNSKQEVRSTEILDFMADYEIQFKDEYVFEFFDDIKYF